MKTKNLRTTPLEQLANLRRDVRWWQRYLTVFILAAADRAPSRRRLVVVTKRAAETEAALKAVA